MKEVHWKLLSLTATTALILTVASWATAQSSRRGTATTAGGGDEVPGLPPQVIVQSNPQRYFITSSIVRGSEMDKIFLYDSWDVVNTKDIWFLLDPHELRSKWKRVPFDKK